MRSTIRDTKSVPRSLGRMDNASAIRVSRSSIVGASSEETKYFVGYANEIRESCNTIVAIVVFPIPPGPRIATRGLEDDRTIVMADSMTYSRPTTISGEAGKACGTTLAGTALCN